ncbi:hypothetical protein JCM11641_003677 [Rhodosporidiobolus odoratus]
MSSRRPTRRPSLPELPSHVPFPRHDEQGPSIPKQASEGAIQPVGFTGLFESYGVSRGRALSSSPPPSEEELTRGRSGWKDRSQGDPDLTLQGQPRPHYATLPPSSQADATGGPPVTAYPATSSPPFVLPPSSAVAEPQPSSVQRSATHLPSLNQNTLAPTSYQNWDVTPELEFTLAKMVGVGAVDEVLKDQSAFPPSLILSNTTQLIIAGALARFRDFVKAKEGSDPRLLDLYNDLKVFSDLATHLRLSSSAIFSTYLSKNSPSRLVLPILIRGPVIDTLTRSGSIGLSLLPAVHELLGRVFERDFKPFLQQRLVEHAVARLGSWKSGYGWTGGPGIAPDMVGDGLADCYCLTNPRLRDHPIVLASEGFGQLTGYPLDAIVGRNCRFLQGPGTAPESTIRMREALNAGQGTTSLLLNYRFNGTPFYNLLCMLPLKDSTGAVKYFLGGQIDVTGPISSLSSLLFEGPDNTGGTAVNGGVSRSDDAQPGQGKATFTPTVQAQTDRLFAAADRAGPGMSVDGMAQLAAGMIGQGTPIAGAKVNERGQQQPYLSSPYAASNSTSTAAASRSTLSMHPPSVPTQPLHQQRSSNASIPASSGPASPSSRRGLSKGAAGVRAVADALANLATGGARRMRKAASEESELGMGWEGAMEDGRRERDRRDGKKAVGPLMAQLEKFEATYSRVILLRQDNREVLYCTPELVAACGAPSSVQFDLTSADFTKLIIAPPPSATLTSAFPTSDVEPEVALEERTRRLRRNVGLTIETRHAWTGLIGLTMVESKGKLFSKKKNAEGQATTFVLHLTPLCDRNGQCEAFVAVFG